MKARLEQRQNIRSQNVHLFKYGTKKQTKVIELTIFEDNKNQDDDKNQNSEIDQYMNNIPLILFLK